MPQYYELTDKRANDKDNVEIYLIEWENIYGVACVKNYPILLQPRFSFIKYFLD